MKTGSCVLDKQSKSLNCKKDNWMLHIVPELFHDEACYCLDAYVLLKKVDNNIVQIIRPETHVIKPYSNKQIRQITQRKEGRQGILIPFEKLTDLRQIREVIIRWEIISPLCSMLDKPVQLMSDIVEIKYYVSFEENPDETENRIFTLKTYDSTWMIAIKENEQYYHQFDTAFFVRKNISLNKRNQIGDVGSGEWFDLKNKEIVSPYNIKKTTRKQLENMLPNQNYIEKYINNMEQDSYMSCNAQQLSKKIVLMAGK